MSTLVLTERLASEHPLAGEDVDYLLTHHRDHIRLTPTRRTGVYSLTPTGHVGTIIAPQCRLMIRPKIPISNLFYLLDPTGLDPEVEDHSEPERGLDLLDVLAARLARLMDERAAAGLHRGYVERAESGGVLHGRLDLNSQIRDRGRDRLHGLVDDFTTDIPCNQVPLATAEMVLRSLLLAECIRAQLRRSLAGFGEVRSVALSEDVLRAATPSRLNEEYRPLIDLCRVLAAGLTSTDVLGTTPFPAFLLDMERVFEQYVTRGVLAEFDGNARYTVAVQRGFVANVRVDGQPDLTMRPDVIVERRSKPIRVIDAKWKRSRGTPLVSEDMYQVIAYCTALGARRALLVYPGRRDRRWKYALARSPVVVEVRTLRVVGAREECADSLRRLGRAAR